MSKDIVQVGFGMTEEWEDRFYANENNEYPVEDLDEIMLRLDRLISEKDFLRSVRDDCSNWLMAHDLPGTFSVEIVNELDANKHLAEGARFEAENIDRHVIKKGYRKDSPEGFHARILALAHRALVTAERGNIWSAITISRELSRVMTQASSKKNFERAWEIGKKVWDPRRKRAEERRKVRQHLFELADALIRDDWCVDAAFSEVAKNEGAGAGTVKSSYYEFRSK